ncbi:hypothetical protein A2851_02310 [Candidatus Kaiserbacteria bacterium RIFCSPHIGHO2_01_FULL_53_29]|uniref:Glycosyltransferase 2-like domain-containing protein n=1 Tax=Candidatus Kaiserbacteria bacterium RIFCSPHIGHO2_01_FULL_53_29 TaxID=1798480 RepID=A0A1F6CWY0_9BACT|nr:MAG: hypothetical protein A2851_02310 [Candidatus Kaiserbacteria bacterium RIFCSPHIGHO2_01_FULL_53_29]
MSPSFTIILPFLRQTDHMTDVVNDFKERLSASGLSYEIIIVMNGMSELDREKIRTVEESPRILECTLRERGWGRAVLAGMREARGEYVCYTNSARTGSHELIRLLTYAVVSKDTIVKATRVERETKMRKWISIAYNVLNRLVLKTPIWDVNATPKIIPKKVLDLLSPTSLGDSIDAEIMYKAFRKGIPIVEIPIRQIERKSGKSTTNWMSALKMFIGLLYIRRNF